MEYRVGSIGRVFLVRFDNKDIFIDEIRRLAKKEHIKIGAILFIGALKKGHIVTGPKKPVIPPEPNWVKFDNAWESLGMGTIFSDGNTPHVHIHSSMGKKKDTLTGCIRKDSSVFLLIEAIILEIKGINAKKALDPKTGINLLKFIK